MKTVTFLSDSRHEMTQLTYMMKILMIVGLYAMVMYYLGTSAQSFLILLK